MEQVSYNLPEWDWGLGPGSSGSLFGFRPRLHRNSPA